MLHVAAPLGLLALASLVVPIALHLIRRPRTTVRVGSLRFLTSQRRRLDTLRWRDPLLLAIRCLLLTALALLIAGASWRPTDTTPARWLLLAPEAELDPMQRAEWNRLRNAGFEPHHLGADFARAELASLTAPADFDAWSLLRELNARLPAESQAHVFGPTPAAWFAGARPGLSHLQVTWTRTATRSRPPSSAPPVTAPARIAVVTGPGREDDARYLRAAIVATGGTETLSNPQWIFQLGGVDLPPELITAHDRGAILVKDAPDAMLPSIVNRTFAADTATLRLRQRIPLAGAIPLLVDSTGEPLLVEQRSGQRRTWQWALRFHPDWTDWPTGGAFPAWWRTHWSPRPVTGLTLAPEQAAPAYAASPSPAAINIHPDRDLDLRPFCWWLALALFVLEFWLRRRPPATATA